MVTLSTCSMMTTSWRHHSTLKLCHSYLWCLTKSFTNSTQFTMMTPTTKLEYERALTICQQYRAQINNEVSAIDDMLIRSLIQDNLGRMSTRCFNMLEKAIAKGYITTSELTAHNLMKLPGIGVGTIKEFQSLINK